jgi:hypothetical protein
MNRPYSALEALWNRYLAGERQILESEIPNLLSERDIKLRADDGELKQITISKPTTIQDSFVVGLRYSKRDRTHTEDHFLCRNQESSLEPVEIERHYKGKLERELPEYKGTHKEQVDFSQVVVIDSPATQVNTISYLVEKK